MHNFIEWLAVDEVRKAYLSRMPAFVVSKDLNHLLWVNGSGALFFGSMLVMDLIDGPTQFDLATRHQIIAGQNSGRPIQLRGVKGRCSFVVSHITLKDEEAWLITSLHDPLNRYERLPLIAGLNNDTIQSAIVDIDGEPLLASQAYDLPTYMIAPHLITLDIGQNKNVVNDDNQLHYYFSVVRLDETYFLVIQNKQLIKEDEFLKPNVGKNLNDEERLAFREIAQRLKQDMASSSILENTIEENIAPLTQDYKTEWPHESDEHHYNQHHISSSNVSPKDLENLLDLATDGVIFLNSELKIQSMTHAAESFLPNAEKKLTGELFTRYLTPESIGQFIAYRTDVDRHAFLNKGCEIEFYFNGKVQKTSITLICLQTGGYAVLLYESGRKQKQFLPTAQDETARKKEVHIIEDDMPQSFAQDKILTNDSEDGAFLARVAHEIRTPLNAMIGFAELMQGEKFGPIHNQRYREYVRDIAQSGHYILSLVNDLLLRAKEKDTGHQPLNEIYKEYSNSSLILKPIDLGVITRDAVNLMHEQANRDGIMLRISFETRLPKIMADARTTKQIILNILSNAIRFTPKGGQIIVSAHRDKNVVILKIKDTGIGMHNHEIERVMRPYEQISPDHVRHSDATFVGTGLGLPLTKALVEENNGRFKIISEHGEGTVVEIQFQQA